MGAGLRSLAEVISEISLYDKIEKEKAWLNLLQSHKSNAIEGVKLIPNEVLIQRSKEKLESYYNEGKTGYLALK